MNYLFKYLTISSIYLLLITSIFTTTNNIINTNKISNIVLPDIPVVSEQSTNDNLTIINNYIDKYHNNEVAGVISILNTDYEKAIMQHSDNDYYLNHLENKKSHYMGSIYLDFRNKISNDKKLLIYGHNSKNISMPFEILENYYEKSYYQDHQYIEIITPVTTRLYQIFSVYIETNDFDYMQTDYDNETTWSNHLTKLKQKSLYETNVEISSTDNILILQTCSTHKAYTKSKKKFLLIIAKEII